MRWAAPSLTSPTRTPWPRVVDDVRPSLIVNAAAYAVDRAEDKPELAFAIDARAPGLLAESRRPADSGLVHYSTDYVFLSGGEGVTPSRATPLRR